VGVSTRPALRIRRMEEAVRLVLAVWSEKRTVAASSTALRMPRRRSPIWSADYRCAGVQLLIRSACKNDFETHALLAADAMAEFA
jgi:hypothetical protein